MKLDEINLEQIDKPIPNVNYTFDKNQNIKNKKVIENNITTNDIEHKKLENQDKEKNRELYKFNKIKKLLYFCIFLIIILILVNVILNYLVAKNNLTNFNSNEISVGIEVLKALIFTISGYLFSKRDT